MEPILKGKSALVTGASKGLGRAIAIRLAEQGARVAVNYNSSQSEASDVVDSIREMDEEAVSVKADVSKLDEVVSMVRSVEDSFGRNIDILINNAGIIHDQLLMRMSDDAWHSVIGTNLNGTFYCCRAAYPHLKESKRGRIISITTSLGRSGWPGAAHAGAAKAGILSLMRALAVEWAPDNILVNSVAPGPIAGTIGVDKLYIETGREKEMTSRVALGRCGEIADIGNAIAYLCSPAGNYVTGLEMVVDGGRQWTFQPSQ